MVLIDTGYGCALLGNPKGRFHQQAVLAVTILFKDPVTL